MHRYLRTGSAVLQVANGYRVIQYGNHFQLLAYGSPVNAELGYYTQGTTLGIKFFYFVLFAIYCTEYCTLLEIPLHVKITSDGHAYPARGRTD